MKRLLMLLLIAAATTAATPPHQHGTEALQAPPPAPGTEAEPVVINIPPVDIGADTLPARAESEKNAAAKLQVPLDFRFTDRLPESGITFVHQIVDDAGKTYKAAHYDHGNGIADVDGDGLIDLYFTNQMGGNELWRNLGNGRFENITASAGVGVPGRVSPARSTAAARSRSRRTRRSSAYPAN